MSAELAMSVELNPGGQAVADSTTEIEGCFRTDFKHRLDTNNLTQPVPNTPANVTKSATDNVHACKTHLFAVNGALLHWHADGGLWDNSEAHAQFVTRAGFGANKLDLLLETECSQVDP